MITDIIITPPDQRKSSGCPFNSRRNTAKNTPGNKQAEYLLSDKQFFQQHRQVYNPGILLLPGKTLLVLHEAAGTGGGNAVGLTGQSVAACFPENIV